MWTVLGAPLDSSASGRGEQRAPRALRAAGVPDLFRATDRGDVTGTLNDSRRDETTGIIAFAQLCTASKQLAVAVAGVLRRGDRPLVLGGDCSLLLGALAGARMGGRVGLWFVDGHADYLDGTLSPTGEAADMELAILTGDGPLGLVDLAGSVPLAHPEDVVILGNRASPMDAEAALELDRVPAELARLTAAEIASDPHRAGVMCAHALGGPGRMWLHIDLDALDETALPAVTYPQPDGLSWTSFIDLIRPLLASRALVGMSIADFNAGLDPDGTHARNIVDAFARALAHIP